MYSVINRVTTLAIALSLSACAQTGGPVGEAPFTGTEVKFDVGKADSSFQATFLDFTFSGELKTRSSIWNPESIIEDQLLYTIGHLNGDRGVGRLDRIDVLNYETSREGDYNVITYTATMPVAWNRLSPVPTEYTFRLPADMTRSALEAFATKYGHDCVDSSAHDVDAGVMWYYYRPEAFRCELDAEDVVEITATTAPSVLQSTGKFPEYDQIWEDDVLTVVAIFGKNEDGSTSTSDAGIRAYNSFVRDIQRELSAFEVTTVPETASQPGPATTEVQINATLDDGRTVEIVALLVDNVRTAGADFQARYSALSPDADLILYNGHAGLGANIRALARRGAWETGKYAIVFMNGCDTYAYVDSALWDAHAAVNPDDPTGTKYLDVVTNAMPAFFHELSDTTTAMVRGLLSYEEPLTYDQIFRDIDPTQVVLVSGEQDNAFVPGGGGGPGEAWEGMEDSGTVARSEEVRFETPALEAGSYLFEMTGSSDADLYVRVGTAPTTGSYDCRPYHANSNETCRVEITTPAAVHVMVRGYSSESEYRLVGGLE